MLKIDFTLNFILDRIAKIKKGIELNKKFLVLLSIVGLLGTSLFAKQDPDMISYKDYVEKKAPTPKQKEVHPKQQKENHGEKVSKGKNSKFAKGQIADENFLNRGTMINTNKYENIKNTDIYRVEDRIFRISRKTREILDILK